MRIKELHELCEHEWGKMFENEACVCGSNCKYFTLCIEADKLINGLEGCDVFPPTSNNDYELINKYGDYIIGKENR